MKWFGRAHGAEYEKDCDKVAVPVGAPCEWCGEEMETHSCGFVLPACNREGGATYHFECYMRRLVGGLNHQKGKCTCCGGTEPPDPPHVTRRVAAIEATRYWHQMNAYHRRIGG